MNIHPSLKENNKQDVYTETTKLFYCFTDSTNVVVQILSVFTTKFLYENLLREKIYCLFKFGTYSKYLGNYTIVISIRYTKHPYCCLLSIREIFYKITLQHPDRYIHY